MLLQIEKSIEGAKNEKNLVAIIVALILMLLVTIIPATPTVNAYDYGVRYASELYTTNWRQWTNGSLSNGAVTEEALGQIEWLFSLPTYYEWYDWWGWVPMYPTYGEVINWGTSTNPNLVYGRIDHVNSEHSAFAAVLYVGHGTADGFYGYSDNGQVPDFIYYDDNYPNDIESHTSSTPTHHFSFMWVCSGGNNSPDGSPSAWNPLYWSYPPTYGPYTWIGFDDASPWLMEWMGTIGDEGVPNRYKHWLVWFYDYALCPSGYSVMQALNYASQQTGFLNYGN